MKRLTSIVAMNHRGAIGVQNRLPWRLKTDLKFFKESTLGNVVIMGRMTFDSLGKRPLPGRCNVVLSHTYGLFERTEDCIPAYGIEDGLLQSARASRNRKECFVIGGASMYEQFSPYVDRYLITLVDKNVPDADTYLNESFFGDPDGWVLNPFPEYTAGPDDETSFVIFELVSKKSSEIKALRDEVIKTKLETSGRPAKATRPKSERVVAAPLAATFF